MTNPTTLKPLNNPLLLSFFLLFLSRAANRKPAMQLSSSGYENATPFLRVLILGDSLTEGYGVLESEAYPSLLEEKLNKELSPKTNLRYKF